MTSAEITNALKARKNAPTASATTKIWRRARAPAPRASRRPRGRSGPRRASAARLDGSGARRPRDPRAHSAVLSGRPTCSPEPRPASGRARNGRRHGRPPNHVIAETRSPSSVSTISPYGRAIARLRRPGGSSRRRADRWHAWRRAGGAGRAGRRGRRGSGRWRRALVLEGLGRHREPGVVGEQRDDALHVAALDRVGEAADQLALARRSSAGARARGSRGGSRVVERRPGALQRALDRSFAACRASRHLGRAEAEHVAQHEHRPLSRRQELQRGHERQRRPPPAARSAPPARATCRRSPSSSASG